MKNFKLSEFIDQNVTFRSESMFKEDLHNNNSQLNDQINNQSVLVIGGAGTIGSSFIKELIKYEPRKLIVVDTNENSLTELTRDLRSSHSLKVPNEYKTYPMDFGDAVFHRMFKETGPFDIVANFAAHKHVRSEKDQYSVISLIQNNLFKADKLLSLLDEFKPKHFFCVSTDKAANPVNVMGASKKMMEEMIMAYSKKFKISTARFANVAFSNGSLLDGFINRISKSQPLSAPKDVKRYFVSPEESGQICLIACILGSTGDVFYPKLRPSQMLTFSQIADRFLKSIGYKPFLCMNEEEAKIRATELGENGLDYPVYYFQSDTTGEKGFEEFYTGSEKLDLKSFSKLGVIKNASTKLVIEVQNALNGLDELISRNEVSKSEIVSYFNSYLSDFDHNETGKNLDQRM
ncbi:UDP-N-acetylglucosamine 4,6-dehydratase [Verrucomicrobiales bacterium]|jgi:FlaA1/EpsC-like NDP-sugar epimerase|nr:UDP-N-acetylglucosamine 4,6-dehydratase [Verrucomicrobiales bacterium]